MAFAESPDTGPVQPARSARKNLPRASRLLRHAEFDRVYKLGRRHFSTSMTVFYLQRNPADRPAAAPVTTGGFRVGFTVSRALGGAVQRNRMRRRLREAVRLCRPASELSVDIVINPRKAVLTTDFTALQQEVVRAFKVIQQKMPRSPENRDLRTENREPGTEN